jgi:hypothetical protein
VEALAKLRFDDHVRGLRAHVIEAATFGELGPDRTPEAAPPSFEALLSALEPLPYKTARARFEAAFEAAYLGHLAARSGGSVSAAARAAGLDRSQLRVLARRADVRFRK